MKFGRVFLIGFASMLLPQLTLAQSPIESGREISPSKNTGAMPVTLDIPSQPLESALKSFSDATHVALFYESSVIAGRRSSALRGEFQAEVALRQILQGTGLSSATFEQGTITILDASRSDEAVELKRAKAGVSAFSHYLASVQRSLDRAFCDVPAVANDPDEMLARLWLAPSGEVLRADLLSSTGSDAGDRTYLAMLGALAIDARPPAAMPQPVNLMIMPRKSRRSTTCATIGTASRVAPPAQIRP